VESYTLQKAANLVMNVRFTGCCASLTIYSDIHVVRFDAITPCIAADSPA
jgi:hypothetical protein